MADDDHDDARRDDGAERAARRGERRGEARRITPAAHRRDHHRADGGGGGAGAAGKRRRNPSRRRPRTTGKRRRRPSHQPEHPLRHSGDQHQFARQDEERHRHQRPGVEGGERALGRDLERQGPVGEQRRHAAEAHRERHRNAQRQQREQDQQQRRGQEGPPSAPPAGTVGAGVPAPAGPVDGSKRRAAATSASRAPPTGTARYGQTMETPERRTGLERGHPQQPRSQHHDR